MGGSVSWRKVIVAGRVGSAVFLAALAGCVAAPRMLKPARPPIPVTSVRFFMSPHWPAHYELMARLDTSGLGGYSAPGTDCLILEILKKQAARIGANAILLKDPPPAGPYGPGVSEVGGIPVSPGGFQAEMWQQYESQASNPYVYPTGLPGPYYLGYAAHLGPGSRPKGIRIQSYLCRTLR